MKITPGATDITLYFKLIDPAAGTPETGLTIANLDLTYVRDRAAAVKADLSTPGGFAVDSAHTDNAAIQVDATNCPGLYRVDVPDAAFLAGVSRVQLCVNGAAIDPAYIEVELETQQTGDSYAQIGVAGAGLTALPMPVSFLPEITAQYGVATKFVFGMMNRAGSDTVAGLTWNGVSGLCLLITADAHIMITDIVSHPTLGQGYYVASLSASQMQFDRASFLAYDLSFAARPFYFSITTYGNPAAAIVDMPQTGDSYARLGSPTGASVSADIADVEGKIDDLEGRVIGTIAAGTHNPQTGDAYAVVSNATYGNSAIHTDLGAVAAVTAKLDTTLVQDGAVYDFTAAALAAAPSGGLNAQDVRDALKLAPTAGAAAAGSVDAHLDDILADTSTLPAAPAATGDAMTLTAGERASVATAVWAATTRTLTSFGTLVADAAAAVWAYARRTLTQTAAQVRAAVEGDDLTLTRGVTFAGELAGLSISATWSKVYLTVKRSRNQADAQAVLQLVVSNPAAGTTDGVLRVEGGAATASQRTQGSLTVNQAGGTVAFDVADDLVSLLGDRTGLVYDVKELRADGSSAILCEGDATIGNPVTWTH